MMILNKLRFTESEIRILEVVSADKEVSISHLCNKTKFVPSMVRRSLASLDRKGFVRKRRVGMSMKASLSDSKHASLFRELVLELRHIPFHDLLAGASLEVLAAICFSSLGTRKEIQGHSNVSESSVSRALSKLKEIGIIQKKENTYIISQRFDILKKFVIEFRHYENQEMAKEFNPNSIILWERNDEFIIESDARKENKKGFRITGPSAFGRFGIRLVMTISYHYYSPRTKNLNLEDTIIHSFLLPMSQRTILPILLVWKKNEKSIRKDYLRNLAEKYKVAEFTDAARDYFDSKGERAIREFPRWKEFVSKAMEYDLRI